MVKEIKRKCTVNITKTTNLPELKLKKLDIMKNSTNGFVPKAASEICKPTTRIAYSRKQGSKRDITKEKDSSQSLDRYFLEDRQICVQEKNKIISDVEEFKTDETPVAVPIHGPSTPHRINMPQNDSEYLDERSPITKKNKESLMVTLFSPATKKPDLSIHKKVASSQSNNHRSIKASSIESTNHSITDYFPVRRSIRKSKKVVLEEKQRDLENKLLCQVEEGIEVKYFAGKGRGIITTRNFAKGEFVVEYIGELINQGIAKEREKIYAQDQNTGCYMYYFQHRNQQYCVDATAETNKLGRLVNHSRNGNLITRIVEVKSIPHLVLTAKEDIPMDVEITYDYGDRSRESIRHHPWLAL